MLTVTLIREAIDDFRRYCRDREVNYRKYRKLTSRGVVQVPSANIKVSDLIIVDKVSNMFNHQLCINQVYI